MNMQQLMQQATQLQKTMQKKQKELEEKVFDISSAGGAIKLQIKGNRQIESIDIDKDALDDKEMLEEMLKIALNDALKQIDDAHNAINNSLAGGLKF